MNKVNVIKFYIVDLQSIQLTTLACGFSARKLAFFSNLGGPLVLFNAEFSLLILPRVSLVADEVSCRALDGSFFATDGSFFVLAGSFFTVPFAISFRKLGVFFTDFLASVEDSAFFTLATVSIFLVVFVTAFLSAGPPPMGGFFITVGGFLASWHLTKGFWDFLLGDLDVAFAVDFPGLASLQKRFTVKSVKFTACTSLSPLKLQQIRVKHSSETLTTIYCWAAKVVKQNIK